MRINTNVSALNSQRILGNTNAAAAKQIGRLSSGFRINRAADDAAGLGIANKLRADIRSMTQASRNAEQAGSLLQVAEGATQTVQSIVDRMKELATQAASDNVNSDSRGLIQAEFSELQDEISRIVDTTKFQGSHLLKTVGAVTAVEATSISSSQDLSSASGTPNNRIVSVTGDYSGSSNATHTITKTSSGYTIDDGSGAVAYTMGDAFQGMTYTESFDGVDTIDAADGTTWTLDLTAAVAATEASGGARDFLVSSSGSYAADDVVTLEALNLELSTLGLGKTEVNLNDKTNARTALDALDGAINTISGVFGDIGAAQNRIEYATANVKTSIENFAAAESTIRDADMAAEMTEFSRLQILQQAGTAMLAQANQAPQGVLQLLR